MANLAQKIDFIGFITVNRANPNGDPLNGNQPRTDYENYGEISDVCLKRKIRNRLQDLGGKILVQSDDRCDDGYDSIRSRVDGNERVGGILKSKEKNKDQLFYAAACREWTDVRSFGQVFAFTKAAGIDAVSIGVRGPVSIHTAVSLDPVLTTSMQITKSVNGEPGEKKGSDTMGMKHRVDFGVYKMQGSINVQLAEKTGFTAEDAQKIKQALITLFENDASSARPEGSVEMTRLYWITHTNKTGSVPSSNIHQGVTASLAAEIDAPKNFGDYQFDESRLQNIAGITIEKYQDAQLVN